MSKKDKAITVRIESELFAELEHAADAKKVICDAISIPSIVRGFIIAGLRGKGNQRNHSHSMKARTA
jgi:hypothetical protein